ncbi:InlB B-repeat-containing protein [Candidatus Latescibacterota bacterium]
MLPGVLRSIRSRWGGAAPKISDDEQGPPAGGKDAFAAKLNSNGVLQWNTFMGSIFEDYGESIAVDGSGNVYVAGTSDNTWGSSPVNAHAGDKDAFATKLNSSGVRQWNTFMGSSGEDEGYTIAVDGSGNAYVAGKSLATWGSPVNSIAGDGDAFASKLNSSGVRQWNTFMGSPEINDYSKAIAVDGSGNAYLSGYSTDTWGSPVNAHAGGSDVFAIKLNSSGVRQWNTFMGSGNTDNSETIAVDGSGNVYVAGYSNATWGSPVSAHAGGDDTFAVELNNSGTRQWNTFMGSGSTDIGKAIAVDGNGDVYVGGKSNSTWGSPNNAYAGDYDAFAAKLFSPEITVSAISGNTTEAGGTATFTIVLTTQPSADVTINLSSSITDEGMVSPASFTFTNGNWDTPRTATITGVNDDIDDGDKVYTIVTAAASSSDGNYDGINPDDVSVTNTDDDTAGIDVSEISGAIAEDGQEATFTVVLTSEPTANVSIVVDVSDSNEASVSPDQLTFTSGNWDTPQEVTVTGEDDPFDDGDKEVTVILESATSADGNYDGLDPDDVSVINVNDDFAGIMVNEISNTTTEAGGIATFEVVLECVPDGSVSITLSSMDTSEGTASPTTLDFDDMNWDTPQEVTVTGVDDDVDDGNIVYVIDFEAATSDDMSYDGMDPGDVSFTNTDDDEVGFIITAISGNTTEAGGTATFTVRLTSEPTDDVSIGVSSSDTGEGTVSTAILTFTSGNWDTPQEVTVTGVDDDIDDGDISFYAVLAVAASNDSKYDGLDPDNVTVTNTDDDTAGFVVGAISGYTDEFGAQATFTVKLTSEPTAGVFIDVYSTDTGEVTVSTNEISFNSGNWNTNQIVTLTGVDDGDDDDDQDVYIFLDPAVSGDSIYDELDPPDIMVTNVDNDPLPTYTVTFVAGTGGSISGSATQIVTLGSDCTPVTAVPATGHIFDMWSGDIETADNPLTITNVTADMTITAEFISLIVINTNDNGPGSLRDAVSYTESGGTIYFDMNYPATISLSSGPIVIDKNLDINGPGKLNLAVSGSDMYRVFEIESGRSVNITQLTISDGEAGTENGGGVLNRGNLLMSDCILNDNSSDGYGGGISNENGTFYAESIILYYNTATEGGGGICNANGTVTLLSSTISGNSAGIGGGIINMTTGDGLATTELIVSTITSNTANGFGGGGIYNQPLMTSIAGSFPPTPAPPFPSGGVTQTAKVILNSCTVTENNAPEGIGGAVFNFQLYGQTEGVAEVEYENTILAGNHATEFWDCYNDNGTMESKGYSLLGETKSCVGATGDINIGTDDPLLGPLADYGGLTPTHSLLSGSPAIDTGYSTLLYDQRGESRSQGSAPDIGAYESTLAYTVTFNAGANGSITGSLSQRILSGGNCTAVTATPNANYVFSGWTGDYTGPENPLTVMNVTSDMTITANFIPDVLSVTFNAGTGGSITGATPQTVSYGGNCTLVSATPAQGYKFIGWSGDHTGMENPLTVSNVTSSMTITANFTVIHSVSFVAGTGGQLTGETQQIILPGANSTAVTAVPDENHIFSGWTGGYTGTENPLTINNVTSDMTITANFIRNYSVTFVAGANGQVIGNIQQTITHGGNCTEVVALPSDGYYFIGWTGDYTGTENSLIISNVISDMTITANFNNSYTVTFSAGDGGQIDGEAIQAITFGGSCTEVIPLPDKGFYFTGWSGDHQGTENPLTISNVTSNQTIIALFSDIWTVSFSADTGGHIDGNTSQAISNGDDCTEVSAMPDDGYRFIGWTGDYEGSENPLVIGYVNSHMSINASFSNTYNVTFTAGPGGQLDGITSQVVITGENSTEVTALPDEGYEFSGWEGDFTGSDISLTVPDVQSDMTINATFVLVKQILTLSVDPPEGGSTDPAEGDIDYSPDEVVDIVATPAEGYVFDSWSGDVDDSGSTSVSITMDSDKSVTANFKLIQNKLLITADPPEGGTTDPPDGEHEYNPDEIVDIIATPAEGYEFDGWSGYVDDSGSTSVSITMDSDKSVTAKFKLIQNKLLVTADPPEGGTTDPPDGEHAYDPDEVVDITASPAEGYRFIGWTGDVADPDNPSTTLTLDTDKTVTANFELAQTKLTMSSEPLDGGTTDPSGGEHEFDTDEIVSITATPTEGYVFDSWTGDVADPSSPSTTVSVTTDISVTANFKQIQKYTLSIDVSPSEGGSASGDGEYDSGTEVTISATPSTGFEFDSWTGDVADPSSPSTTVSVNADISVTVIFRQIQKFTLSIDVNPPEGGSASGEGEFELDAVANITATPSTGFEFANWSGNVADPSNPSTTVTMTADVSVTANFERIQSTFKLDVSASIGGTVTGSGTYDSGSFANISATSAANYRFISWSGDVTDQSSASTTVNMDADKSVTANFELIPVQQTYALLVHTSGGGTASGTGSYNPGSVVNISAVPDDGYGFTGWTGDVAEPTNASTTVTMDSDKSVTANFELLGVMYNLTVSSNPNGGGTVSGTGTYGENTEATVTATPADGYKFIDWAGEVADPTSTSTTVTMDSDKSVTANFEYTRKLLTMSVEPPASGITSPSPGEYVYEADEVVTLTATPAFNYLFAGWNGDVADPNNPSTTVTMSDNMSVSAVFVKVQYVLAIENTPAEGGTTTPAAGSHQFDAGTVIPLVATPSEGYGLIGWAGGVAEPENRSTTILMDGPKQLTASFFEKSEPIVTEIPATGGQISVDDNPELNAVGLGELVVDIPAGALSEPIKIQVEVPAPEDMPESLSAYQQVEFTVSNADGHYEFGQPVTITIPYPETLIDEGNLVIKMWDEATEAWIPLELSDSIIIDTANNTISGDVNTFSIYGVLYANNAPVIVTKNLKDALDKIAYADTIVFRDKDAEDICKCELLSAPTWVSLDEETGVLTGIPGNADVIKETLIKVKVTDPAGLFEEKDFLIDVLDVNEPPSITSELLPNGTQDAEYTALIEATDPDPDTVLRFELVDTPPWMTIHEETGVISGVPTNGDVSDDFTVKVKVTDNGGISDEKSFIINVLNVNDPPSILSTTLPDAYDGEEYSVLLSFIEVDEGDSIVFGIPDKPEWLTIDQSGLLSGLPSNDDIGAGMTVTVTLIDAFGLADTLHTTISVINVNDFPEIITSELPDATEKVEYHVTLEAQDKDMGEILTFNRLNVPEWLNLDDNGTLTGVPDNKDTGIGLPVVIVVTDIAGFADTLSTSISVINIEEPPVIQSPILMDATEGSVYEHNLMVADPDKDDIITYSFIEHPEWLTIDESGLLVGTPLNDDVGENVAVSLMVYDVAGLADTLMTTIAVINVNNPPEVANTSLWDATEGLAYSDTLEVTDPDLNDIEFTYELLSPPDWLQVDDSGILSGTPGSLDVETGIPLTIVVIDIGGLADTLYTKINVIMDVLVSTVEIAEQEAVLRIGEYNKYSATALNALGSEVEEALIHWTVLGDIGEINDNGIFAATRGGTGFIVASVTVKQELISAQVEVTVFLEDVTYDGIISNTDINIEDATYPLDFMNGAHLYFPENSLTNDIQLMMKLPKLALIDDVNKSIVYDGNIINAITFDVLVNNEIISPYSFSEPVEVSLPFNQLEVSLMGIDSGDLRLFYVTETGEFDAEGIYETRSDISNNIVVGKVDHFSTVAIASKYDGPTLLGDFDYSLSVDFYDFAQLLAFWNDANLNGDIAGKPEDVSAAGIPPWYSNKYIYPSDGIIDFEDFAIFAMMYNWDMYGMYSEQTLPPVLAKDIPVETGLKWEENEYNSGDIFTVSVNQGNITDYLGSNMKLTFDDTVLKVKSVKSGFDHTDQKAKTPVFYRISGNTINASTILLGNTVDKPLLTNGNVFDIEFEVIGGGEFTIDLLKLDIRDSRNNPVFFTSETISLYGHAAGGTLPLVFGLSNNYPNPFNMITTLKYTIEEDGEITIAIYNSLGQYIKTLVSEFKSSGTYTILWDGTDNDGNEVTSGIYFVSAKQGRKNITRQLLLLK